VDAALDAIVAASQRPTPSASYFHRLTCVECGINVHLGCHCEVGGADVVTSGVMTGEIPWKCGSCDAGEKDPRCVLCPRRGGAFRPTTDARWAHVFCARHAPGSTRISADSGTVDIRMIPKVRFFLVDCLFVVCSLLLADPTPGDDATPRNCHQDCRKSKCCVCNRPQGACVRCTFVGCTNWFHPLCAERKAQGLVRTRLGEKEAYCHEHAPDGLDRAHGYLVDGGELHRLRASLDRARVILDLLQRREKFKLRLCKAEGDLFQTTFQRTLDKAKGRKVAKEARDSGGGGLYSSDEGSEYEDDGDYGDGDDSAMLVDDLGAAAGAAAGGRAAGRGGAAAGGGDLPAVATMPHYVGIDFTARRGEDITAVLPSTEAEVAISGFWTDATTKEVALPKRIAVMVGGCDVRRKDANVEGGKKGHLKVQKRLRALCGRLDFPPQHSSHTSTCRWLSCFWPSCRGCR